MASNFTLQMAVPQICAALSRSTRGSWTVVSPGPTPHYYELVSGDRRLVISSVWGEDRYKLSGSVSHLVTPDGKASEVPYGMSIPIATVSASKDPVTIARDLVRRVLPGYQEVLAEVVKRLAERQNHADGAMNSARRLASLVGCQVNDRNPERPNLDLYRSREFPEMTGDLRVSGDEATFDRFAVSVDEAHAMLQALIACRRAKASA